MDWFYNKQIILMTVSEGYMYHGSWVEEGYTQLKTIACDVQPANRELIFKEYGYYIDCKYRVFCDINSIITLGCIVKYSDNYFIVDKIIVWDDYFDMFLNEYKGVVVIG